jgi:hydrogenase maturation protease
LPATARRPRNCGTSPDALACLEPTEKLIIVDAAETGVEPGAIYRFRPEDLAGASGGSFSLHEVGVAESLKMIQLMGNTPGEVVIIGIQPKEICWGMELSPDLTARVAEIVSIVLEEINR